MSLKKKILIVDDEVKVTEVLYSYLTKENYEVHVCHNGADALRIIDCQNISLLILDLMLPDMTGEDICRTIRRRSRLPIIMVTAKVDEQDLLNGLNIGADDYLMKPVSPKTVVAKIQAVLRRVESDELVSLPISYGNSYLTIDFKNFDVKINGQTVNLTPTEYKLLSTMAKSPGRIYSRDQLISYALRNEFDGFDRSIDTYIKSLRSKIEPNRRKPSYIVTEYGVGYKFNDNN